MDDLEQRRIFSRNLNYYIDQSGLQQKEIAKALGISPTTMNTWCVGKILPRISKIQILANYFGVSLSDLIDDKIHVIGKKKAKGVTINVYGKVAAGIPIEAIEDIIDTEDIPDELAKTGEFFGLRIQGDSMEPDIKDGDTVIVRRQETADEGQIVIAMVNGYDATCKRLRLYDDSIALEPLNATYAPMYYTKREVEEKPVSIIGVVKESRRKF